MHWNLWNITSAIFWIGLVVIAAGFAVSGIYFVDNAKAKKITEILEDER